MTTQQYITQPRQQTTQNISSWALRYLAHEWSIFPVCSPLPGGRRCAEHEPGKHEPEDTGKTPLVKWAPYQTEPPSADDVRRWWSRWPNANIGLVTGSLSGVAIVDLDSDQAAREAERLGYLPGPWARTGRIGCGMHLYFAWRDDAPTIFAKRNGIDFRGKGGYAVLPPSLHRSMVRYEWGELPFQGEPLPPLPKWVDELAGPSARRGAPVVGEVIANGMRSATMASMAGTMRRRGFGQRAIEAALLIENDERCQPPLEPDEVAKIAESVARYSPAPVQYRAQGVLGVSGVLNRA